MKTIELWPEAGVRPDEQEQVREAGDGRALVRLRAALPRPRRASARRGRGRASPIGMSVTWKPVPKMIVSTSRSVPSAVTIERVADLARSPSVTSSTFGLRERRVLVVARAGCACSRSRSRASASRAARGRAPALRRCLTRDPPRRACRRGGVRSADDERLARPVDRRRASRSCACGTRRKSARSARLMRRGRGAARPTAACAGRRAAARRAAGSRARTGSPTRRCRSPRRARRPGRGRGPSAPSGTSCPRSVSRPGQVRDARLAQRRPGRRSSTSAVIGPCDGRRAASAAASSSHVGAVHLVVEAHVRHRRRSARRTPRR